jgi:murein DD-endopeptidase MepM/ murein hydrolase activator NlpD
LSRRRSRFVFVLVLIALAALAWGAWGAFRVGEAPEIEIASERSAIGRPGTDVRARFSAPADGFASIRLEVVQGDQSAVLAERSFEPRSPFDPTAKPEVVEAELEATVGQGRPEWLEEGEAVVRAVAERFSGPLRSPDPVTAESTYDVRFRPPTLAVVSSQHYVGQGGAGAVVFVAGETSARSGVRVGERDFASWGVPGATDGSRFSLFAIPWDVGNAGDVRVFAEDAAGNRAERAFVDIFKERPPTRDRIRLSDRFFQKVVPAIVEQTPELDSSGSLLDVFLRINGDLRASNRAFLVELSRRSVDDFLWSGGFLALPNGKATAPYGDARTYFYEGREVDFQTHLGLDLASSANAPIPAANDGVVVFAGYLGIYGKCVVVDHGYGLQTLYAHLASIAVDEGAQVIRGDTIGTEGATGLAGGAHLHFGVFVQGVPVNPIEWLDAKWIRDRIGSKIPLRATEG